MAKIQIASLRSQKEGLLRFLQEEGVVHLLSMPTILSNTDGPSSTSYRLTQLQSTLQFITRLRAELHWPAKRTWRNVFSGKPVATLAELETTFEQVHLDGMLAESDALSDRLSDLVTEKIELDQLIVALEPWTALAVTGRDLSSFPRQIVRHALCIVTGREQERFLQMISGIPSADWQVVHSRPSKKNPLVYLEVIVHSRHGSALDLVIKEVSAQAFVPRLPMDATIADTLADLCRQRQASHEAYTAALASGGALLDKEQSLLFAYDALLHRQERELASGRVAHLPLTIVLTGWLPAEYAARLRQRLRQSVPGAYVEEIQPEADEQPPVTLKNHALIEPFEAVTNIYGQPAYHEIDPTPALSVFFLVAFGLALTDAGYGLVMAAVMALALKFLRLKKAMRQMVKLLAYAGLMTVVFGALTGGWFGLALEDWPPGPGRDFLLSLKIIDPIRDTMTLLLVIFMIGIIQLLFGWMVRGYHHWRNRERLAILLDDIPWIGIVLSLLAWTASQRGLLPASWQTLLGWTTIAFGGVLMLTQGRSAKNIFTRLGSGAMSLYGLVGFLSDTLSYSRLLALGLATGIIALVVNLLASMVYGSIPAVGFIFAIVVLLIGHLFNLGINVLGAFIHSGRLQFVEFFPKFLAGGGLAYKPFGRVSRYVDNPRDFE